MARRERFRSSVTLKLMLVSAVFLIVPALLYGRFEQADAERKALMVNNLQIQGRLAAQALQEKLIASGARAPVQAQDLVDAVSRGELRIKLLLRPADNASSYYYIASAPHLTEDERNAGRDALISTGLLLKATESCAGNRPLATQYEGPTGVSELLTSLTPFHTEHGCWLVVTSYPEDDPVIASLTRPFSAAPELRWAAMFYVAMAVLSVWAGWSIWQALRRFGNLARRMSESSIEPSTRFVDLTPVQELQPIATAMDRMVDTMRRAASAIREAAEENAHALKGPVASIRQALEALRNTKPDEIKEAAIAIDRSLSKLDSLISTARRIDHDIASSIAEGRSIIDLSALAANAARAANEQQVEQDSPKIDCKLTPDLAVVGSEEAIETVLENLLDNAVGFSPKGSTVKVTLKRAGDRARLSVEDQGPGVPPDLLPHIFERHFSTRNGHDALQDDGQPHFGLGLAIVRRNVAMLGGVVSADNGPDGGFRVVVDLPLAHPLR
ncbi:MAG: HAMP domain-containing histidine kinase [Rhodospirillaceae bacterium]|nr:HAMP domain-containing histidine kinase [Rhodospirillaceae bacterium]